MRNECGLVLRSKCGLVLRSECGLVLRSECGLVLRSECGLVLRYKADFRALKHPMALRMRFIALLQLASQNTIRNVFRWRTCHCRDVPKLPSGTPSGGVPAIAETRRDYPPEHLPVACLPLQKHAEITIRNTFRWRACHCRNTPRLPIETSIFLSQHWHVGVLAIALARQHFLQDFDLWPS